MYMLCQLIFSLPLGLDNCFPLRFLSTLLLCMPGIVMRHIICTYMYTENTGRHAQTFSKVFTKGFHLELKTFCSAASWTFHPFVIIPEAALCYTALVKISKGVSLTEWYLYTRTQLTDLIHTKSLPPYCCLLRCMTLRSMRTNLKATGSRVDL